MKQLSIFDNEGIRFNPREGRARRDAAMAVSEIGKDEWLELARQTVLEVARLQVEFTTDAIWEFGLRPPPSGSSRALGPVMLWASKHGVIQRTDRTRATKKAESHAQPLRIWRSKVFSA